jgi:hypothetical protein
VTIDPDRRTSTRRASSRPQSARRLRGHAITTANGAVASRRKERRGPNDERSRQYRADGLCRRLAGRRLPCLLQHLHTTRWPDPLRDGETRPSRRPDSNRGVPPSGTTTGTTGHGVRERPGGTGLAAMARPGFEPGAPSDRSFQLRSHRPRCPRRQTPWTYRTMHPVPSWYYERMWAGD